MPELPEVETVRRGLSPFVEGARLERVVARRPDLRFPLPEGFEARLTGRTVERLDRRGKYLVARLDGPDALIMHLGMSGRFTVRPVAGARSTAAESAFAHAQAADPRHDHVSFGCVGASGGDADVDYNDPRRFGFMDLAQADALEACRHFKGMGPEPLSNGFSGPVLAAALKGRRITIKAALLDQRIVAGLGNIYVCEALWRARVSPRRRAASIGPARAERLAKAIREVLSDAILAGGSTLRDYAGADGALGYFQHAFDVYGRAGAPCRACGREVVRIVQAARSTFFCGACQK